MYHYTNFDSLLKILSSLSLLPSGFSKLNDLSEGQIYIADYEKMFEIEDEIDKCSILCFCKNYFRDGTIHEVTNHPRSWAQYGENCKGACIVIRKDDFIKVNEDRLSRMPFYFIDKIDYVSYNFANEFENLSTEDDNLSSIEFIKKYHNNLFYRKYADWKDEDEVRMLLYGLEKDETLSLDGAIDSICLGPKLLQDDERLSSLKAVLNNPDKKCYKKFIPQSFSTVASSSSGYMTDGVLAASKMTGLD